MTTDLRPLLARARENPAAMAAFVASLTDAEAEAFLHDWRGVWARKEQLGPLPNDWTTWVIDAGRGFGKTRAGAEFVREKVDQGKWRIVALVARTPRDARKVMIEGESGLLSVWPDRQRPVYNPSLAQVTFWNGAVANIYSDEVPDQLRGPQHHGAWVDEFCKFVHPRDTWDQLQLGLRLGRHPQAVVTTTPRPLKIFEEIIADPGCVRTTGSTYDNWTNLPASFRAYIKRRYEGTSLGEQEIFAKHLKDAEGALWTRELIDKWRVPAVPDGVTLRRVVVGVDPAVTSNEESDETGIVGVALGSDDRCYVLDDASGVHSPAAWAAIACDLYEQRRADVVVGEVNNGGDLVETNLRAYKNDDGKAVGLSVSYKAVRASRGKAVRAEPVKSLYEQGRVRHVGVLGPMEDEMCTWVPGRKGASPNHVDALVWAVHELVLGDYVDYRISTF